MSATRILTLIAMVVALGGCGPQYAGSPSDSTAAEELGAIAVMPPEFRVEKVGELTHEETWEIADDFEAEITKMVTSLVARSKYSLAPLDVSNDAVAADPRLRASLANQEAGIRSVLTMLVADGDIGSDAKYAADVTYLASLSAARYLLFVRGAGYFDTFPAQMKEEIFRHSGDSPGVGLVAFLVDTTNNRIVWHNTDFKTFRPPDDKEGLWPMGRAMFRSLLGVVDAPENSFWK